MQNAFNAPIENLFYGICFLVKQYENKRNLNLFYQIKINNINHFEFLLSVSFFQTARFDETCSALTFNIGIALAVV